MGTPPADGRRKTAPRACAPPAALAPSARMQTATATAADTVADIEAETVAAA
jgi:hypothetical protein